MNVLQVMQTQYKEVFKMQHKKKVAYFSMGSGIYNDLLTYSGGLEILAGDMIKEVMDHPEQYPMVFFHILWKKARARPRMWLLKRPAHMMSGCLTSIIPSV